VSLAITRDQLTLLRELDGDWFDLGRFPRMDHVSPSMANKFADCPEQGRQRYILGKPELPAEMPLIGTAVHRGIEWNMQQKITSHVDLPIAEVVERYDDEIFMLVVGEEEEKVGQEIVWDTSYEDAKTRGRLMLGEYHNREAAKIQPIDVEGSFSVPMGLPVKVQGRYDILTADRAIDLKTGKQRTTKPKSSWLIQGAIYSFATGLPVEFHTMACTQKDHKVSIVTPLESEDLYYNPSQAEIDALAYTVRTIMYDALHYLHAFGPDNPWPTRGRFHIWACDYCSFRAGCPAWPST
jgi:hypothetical protein